MPWTKQEADAAAARSAEVRRQDAEEKRRRLAEPAPPARQTFEEAAGRMALELVDAATGRGDFKTLAPDKRLAAVIKVLEFGVGRPAQSKPETDKPDALRPEELFS